MGKIVKKTLSPAALEAWRDFGNILKKFRNEIKLSKKKLSQQIGISAIRIDELERAIVFPKNSEISRYIKIALQFDHFPGDILEAFSRAEDEIKGLNREIVREDVPQAEIEYFCVDRDDKCNIWESAIQNPKKWLEGARWLPALAQIRIGRIDFWERVLAEYDNTMRFLLQCSNCPGLVSKQSQDRIYKLKDRRESVADLVKNECMSLAKDAKSLFEQYKKIESIFDTYANDLPGCTLVKDQYFFGMTLYEVISQEGYTRRWAQTLQARTLQIFRDRIGDIYDKRGAGAFN